VYLMITCSKLHCEKFFEPIRCLVFLLLTVGVLAANLLRNDNRWYVTMQLWFIKLFFDKVDFTSTGLEFIRSKIQLQVVPLKKVYFFGFISYPLTITIISLVCRTQIRSPSSVPLLGNFPYFLFSFIHIINVDEVPPKLFTIKKQ